MGEPSQKERYYYLDIYSIFRYNSEKVSNVLRGEYSGDVNLNNSLLSQIQVRKLNNFIVAVIRDCPFIPDVSFF